MFRFHSLISFLLLFSSNASSQQPSSPPIPSSKCNERCGHLHLPFPFYLNDSCGPPIDAFRLSCRDNPTAALFLTLGDTDLHVIDFFPAAGTLLVDFSAPNASASSSSSFACDRQYFHVSDSTVLNGSPFFGVSSENVLRLYDCEDSSLCKTGCGSTNGGGCEGNGSFSGCCYPLSDGSVWKLGDGFSVFSEFGCRGFSSWVSRQPSSSDGSGDVVVERGLEIEWAVPWGSGGNNRSVCVEGAKVVNSTAVEGGVRCACADGFAGDGFTDGVGCLKPCVKDGHLSYGGDCCTKRICKWKTTILVGILVSSLSLAALASFCAILRWRTKSNSWDSERNCFANIVRRSSRTRLFTYQELSKATGGFEDDMKLVDDVDVTVHAGKLDDGSLVAVQKIRCETEQILMQFLDKIGVISQISHRNVTRIFGCCVNSSNTLLLVHEFFSSGTLEDLLQREKGNSISWRRRINIAIEVANALAFLEFDVDPPIYVHDLKSSDILVDIDYSAKIAGFKLLGFRNADGCCLNLSHGSHGLYNFGLILLEIIVGLRHEDLPKKALQKIISSQLEEIVDPFLGFGNLPARQREQIERVADLATQCLLCRENNRLFMNNVAKELSCIMKSDMEGNNVNGPALEVTFSNSSLLQMVSMSPETKYLP